MSIFGFMSGTSYTQKVLQIAHVQAAFADDTTPVPASGRARALRGVYVWLQAINSRNRPLELHNSNVDGMSFHTNWNIVEPEQGVFDWSALDAHVSAATAAGKHFALTIAAGVNTPQWVYGLGASSVKLSRGTVPIPWDPIYLQNFKRMVAQMGAHYANNPALEGVHVTGLNSMSGETNLINRNVVDCAVWMRAGYTSTLVISAFSQILTEFNDDFPDVQLSASIVPGGFCEDATGIDWSMDGRLLALGGWVPLNSGLSNHWIMPDLTGYQEVSPLGSLLPAALNLALAQPSTRYLELYFTDLDKATLTARIFTARQVLLSR